MMLSCLPARHHPRASLSCQSVLIHRISSTSWASMSCSVSEMAALIRRTSTRQERRRSLLPHTTCQHVKIYNNNPFASRRPSHSTFATATLQPHLHFSANAYTDRNGVHHQTREKEEARQRRPVSEDHLRARPLPSCAGSLHALGVPSASERCSTSARKRKARPGNLSGWPHRRGETSCRRNREGVRYGGIRQ